MSPVPMHEKTIVIVQPYIAAYNVPLFEHMSRSLAQRGFRLELVAGSATGSQALRRDSDIGDFSLHQVQSQRNLPWPFQLDYKPIAETIRRLNADYVILEQARSHVESYGQIWRSLIGQARLAWWGHGAAFHGPESRFAAAWRQSLLYTGDWFFAYSQRGAEAVIARGFPPNRISVLNNSTDTRSFRNLLDEVSAGEIRDFLSSVGGRPGATALFIGGVDEAKGIRMLLDSARVTAKVIPDYRLVIAGRGRLEDEVEQAQLDGLPVTFVGRLDDRAKAVAFRSAEILAVPRAVGLVAVESLAAGLPIVTTVATGHGPEFDYLTAGVTCEIAGDSAEDFGRAIAELLCDEGKRARIRASSMLVRNEYSIESMSERFTQGMFDWVEVTNAGLGRASRRNFGHV